MEFSTLFLGATAWPIMEQAEQWLLKAFQYSTL